MKQDLVTPALLLTPCMSHQLTSLWSVRNKALSRPPSRSALLLLTLFPFFRDRVRSVACADPVCRPGNDGFIFEPKKSEVVDALRKVRLDDDVSRDHRTRNVGVVGSIVAIGLRLRNRTDASYIRSAGDRMRAEDVIDGAKCIFGAYKVRKCLVQEVHPYGHVDHSARSAPGAKARGHAERGGVQLLVQTRHVGLYRLPHLIFRA